MAAALFFSEILRNRLILTLIQKYYRRNMSLCKTKKADNRQMKLKTRLTVGLIITAAVTARLNAGQHGLIAHALGEVNGTTYTNSLEAFEKSLEKGFKIFEADLALTSDNVVVCFHRRFEKKAGLSRRINEMTYREFSESRIFSNLTPLSLTQLLAEFKKHRDILLILDAKTWTPGSRDAVMKAIRLQPPSVRKRIIPEFYRFEELSLLREVRTRWNYPFEVFAAYQSRYSDDELIRFFREKEITAAAFPVERFDSEFAERLNAMGIFYLTHTVNDGEKISEYRKNGADGIYADSF